MSTLKMPDINNVVIAGNLTSEPVLRQTKNGTRVANFWIAANRKFKDSSGQWRETVCFVGIVAWHKLAESCYRHLQKGSAVLIEGELQSRSWKGEHGSNSSAVEIKARRIQFLNKPVPQETVAAVEEVREVTNVAQTELLAILDERSPEFTDEFLSHEDLPDASEINVHFDNIRLEN